MKYRTINVDLNRQYREDLNWNFQQIADDIKNSDDISDENKQALLEEIERVERESKERDDLLAGESLEELLQSIDDAKKAAHDAAAEANLKGDYADEKGDYAQEQGDYAKEQGEYASQKGGYADEKAIAANEAAANANEEASNLDGLKTDAVSATQDANNAAESANEQASNAEQATTDANQAASAASDAASEASSQANNAEEATTNAEHATTEAQAIADNTRYVEEYSSDTAYSKNNFVRYEGSTYISLVDSNKGNSPNVNGDTDYWALAARRGKDGTGSVDSVNNKTGDVVLNAEDVGAETPTDAQEKADTAEQNAKDYTDEKISEIDLSPYAEEKDLEDHVNTEISEAEAHGIRLNPDEEDVLQFKNKEGNWVDVKGGGDEIQVAPVSDLTVSSSTDGKTINLSWLNPNNDEYLRTEIYASETDISEAKLEYIKDNASLIVDGTGTSYNYSTSHGKLTYFKAYAVHSLFGNDKYSEGVAVNSLAQDTEPPGTITNFNAAEDNEQIILTWKNPTDDDFDKVKILYKTSGYPTSSTDGTVAYEGSATTVDLTGLTNDTTYYFRAFTYDQVGNVNSSTSGQQITGEPSDAKLYGLRWNQTKDTYERLGEASGQGRVFFDDKYPWSEMKRLNLSDAREILAFLGDPTYKTDGSNGQVMIQVMKFWYKFENYIDGGDNIYEFWIADNSIEGFKLHPGFIRNGAELPCFFFSAYEGSLSGNKLQSISGVKVKASETIVKFREYAQARGTGWEQQTFLQTCAIQLLYVIEYADFNSQDALAEGRTNISGYADTGKSEILGNESGGDNEYMSYRGIENFWGNYFKWVDGLNFQDRKLYVADHDFESGKFSGNYEDVGITLPNSNGYVKDIQYASGFDYAFMSKDNNGSSSTYIPDYQYTSYSGSRVARFSGARSSGSEAGAFCWAFLSSASSSAAVVAARLLCFPEAE